MISRPSGFRQIKLLSLRKTTSRPAFIAASLALEKMNAVRA
ncbi:hypothetical protein LEP1GSC108_2794 [Leptospira weilii str. UI 13098]|uniref:Uncharacterized protein n=1 Tax=Leptospira weilii str. UI 13098 TaxID=1088542 RepID=M6QD72_9LEPT|nr:hypothetical protein LEP1GSC108_2794 [Leptospira weilii str. UI 13098]